MHPELLPRRWLLLLLGAGLLLPAGGGCLAGRRPDPIEERASARVTRGEALPVQQVEDEVGGPRVMVAAARCQGAAAACELALAGDLGGMAVTHLIEHGYQAVSGRQAIGSSATYRSAPGEIRMVAMLLAQLEGSDREDRWRREGEIYEQFFQTRAKVLPHLGVEGVLQIQLVLGKVGGKHEVEVSVRLELGSEGRLAWQSRCVRAETPIEEELSAAGAARCALAAMPEAQGPRPEL